MSILPKSNTKSVQDNSLPAGSLVTYENDGSLILAMVLGYKNQKYLVFNDRGRELELAAQRLHRLPGQASSQLTTSEARTKHLTELNQSAIEQAKSIDVGEIWQFVHEDKGAQDTTELVKLYLGSDTLANHLALRIALINDRIYFKRKEDTFVPRAFETVEELRLAETAKEKKAGLQSLTVGEIGRRLNDPSLQFSDQVLDNIYLLEDIAAGCELDGGRQKEGKDLLALLQTELKLELPGANNEKAFNLLRMIGHFTDNTNLVIYRHKPAIQFSQSAEREALVLDPLEAVAKIVDQGGDRLSATRIDLTKLESFTIDDTTTRDMDDAISIEQTVSGYRLGIHISDVGSCVIEGSALDKDAKLRATSIYLPERTIHMFPDAISEDKLSLVQDQVRPALSCLFELDPSFQLVSSQIVPSFVKVARRYTYEEVDELLENDDHRLNTIYQIASAQEEKRLQNGARKIAKRDATIVIEGDGRLRLVEIDESAPSRNLIGELMVMANHTVAQFGVEHQIPLVFRSQPRPDDDGKKETNVPDGPAQEYATRTKLKRSSMSPYPEPHATLGLDAYIQITSPIRRYLDIVNQRQVLSWLRTGQVQYNSEQIEKLIYEAEGSIKPAGAISKESKRFWLMRYLQELPRNTEIRGVVIRTDLKNPLVEIDLVHLPVFAKVNRPVKIGEELTLRIASIDPHADYIKLEMV